MPRRLVACLALLALVGVAGNRGVEAHAALRLSTPLSGVALGDTPTAVRLTFSEPPDVTLSEIRVVDTAGVAYQLGQPLPTAGDPLSLFVNIKPLDRGVYTVTWRTVSSVDGHASAGTYAFGVRAEPTAGATSTTTPPVSLSEIVARWVLIVGLVMLLGGAAASVARFGGGSELAIAGIGCGIALTGVVLLAIAQTENAGASLARLLTTNIGRALLWRFAAIAVAAAALVTALRAGRQRAANRRTAMGVVLLATLAAMAAHVSGGHAAANPTWTLATVASQWAHFAAVGIWLGGLGPLLLGLQGAPAAAKTEAVRRFASVATIAVIVVAVTGVTRTFAELSGWSDLTSTGYGLAVLVKIALTIGIVALAAGNHWRNVARAAADLRPLRRAATGELTLAIGALAAAAVLGAFPPPAAALRDPSGLVATGADFGTTLRVRLTTPSDQPGPNRFVVQVVDYDSQEPIDARNVSLRFTPLDDPGIASTTLDLLPGPDDSFVGSGANLAFDGRWRLTALIERAGNSVEVPMEVETRSPQQFLAVARPPGQPRTYRIQVEGAGHIWISPDPERPGRSTVTITCFDLVQDLQSVQNIVVTAGAGSGPAREQVVRRVNPSTFVTDIDLQPGLNRIAVVARAPNGTRLRGVLDLEVPR
jgi:copper transport protein